MVMHHKQDEFPLFFTNALHVGEEKYLDQIPYIVHQQQQQQFLELRVDYIDGDVLQ